jgi:hypothetical protein
MGDRDQRITVQGHPGKKLATVHFNPYSWVGWQTPVIPANRRSVKRWIIVQAGLGDIIYKTHEAKRAGTMAMW